MKSKKIELVEGDLHKEFLDVQAVKKELAQCLIEGDFRSFQEIFSTFIEACNKYDISKKTSISRNTLYRIRDKENLTIKKAFDILNAAS